MCSEQLTFLSALTQWKQGTSLTLHVQLQVSLACTSNNFIVRILYTQVKIDPDQPMFVVYSIIVAIALVKSWVQDSIYLCCYFPRGIPFVYILIP